MDRINLLPDEARLGFAERITHAIDQNFPRVLMWTVGAIAAGGILLSAAQAVAHHRGRKHLAGLKEQVKLLEVETQNLESFSEQLEKARQELKRQQERLDKKISYLGQARSKPKIWAEALKDLRRNIPTGVWLTEMETGSGSVLRIGGGALDENLVTQFMSNLKLSPRFSDVGFTFTEKDAIGKVAMVKFEIVCKVG